MSILFYGLIVFLFCAHVFLMIKQLAYLSRQGEGTEVQYARSRCRIVLLSFMLDIAWLFLLIFGDIFTGPVWISGLILARSLIRRLILGITQTSVEKYFGFSRMTIGLFIKDMTKSLGLQVFVIIPTVFLVFSFMPADNSMAYLWVWLVWFCLDSSIMAFKPMTTTWLFHTKSDITQDELQSRLNQLAQRVGLKKIELTILDGSKRSSHANARMEGIGPLKRLVVLDTLFEKLTGEEIEAVVAHELGHQQLHHIPLYQFLKGALALIGLYLFAQTGLSLAALVIMVPALSCLALPLLNGYVRRCEYQADAFAARYTNASLFCKALDKIHQQNNSLETSHPLYSWVYQGHPMASKRKAKLKELEELNGSGKMYVA